MSIILHHEDELTCPICLQEYEKGDVIVKMNCCHQFIHKTCLKEWRKMDKMKNKYNCVLCRSSVPNSMFEKLQIYVIDEEKISLSNETNINITININNENKCFIDRVIEYFKLDSCFQPDTSITNYNSNRSFMSRI